jgi:hypothetical protein
VHECLQVREGDAAQQEDGGFGLLDAAEYGAGAVGPGVLQDLPPL